MPDNETKELFVPSRMKQSELRQFILDYCDGKIYTDRDIPKEQIMHVFMILLFAEVETWDRGSIGVIWEYSSRAGPMAINGYPTFMSCRIMHKEDWKICFPAIERELKRRKNLPILVPVNPELKEIEQEELFKEKE